MAPGPSIKPLSRMKRRIYFRGLFLIFVLAMPLLLLYATGYRYDDVSFLVSTGGVYVGANRAGAEIYVDGELVRETGTFRRAFYVQNLEPGVHRVHVQMEGHHTWVKEIDVIAHRVAEAYSFNMPLEPEVREIPRWQLQDGTLLFELGTSTATTTKRILESKNASTTRNAEYADIKSLFSTSTATTTPGILSGIFGFNQDDNATTSENIREERNLRIVLDDGELFASWTGSEGSIPYYFCTSHVDLLATTSLPIRQSCRDEIRIDRSNEEIIDFDFYPRTVDLVLLQTESGLYVQEIDDRGWQNRQPIYQKEDIAFRVRDGRIYVEDGVHLLEIIVE